MVGLPGVGMCLFPDREAGPTLPFYGRVGLEEKTLRIPAASGFEFVNDSRVGVLHAKDPPGQGPCLVNTLSHGQLTISGF